MQVTETIKRVLGVGHPLTLINIANLASTYRNQGWWKEAEELEVQMTETIQKVLGSEHPSTLISLANLASTLLESRAMEGSRGAADTGDENDEESVRP